MPGDRGGLPTGSLPGAAAWDGTDWSSFHGGLDASARASLVVDTELYIAGGFESVDLARRLPSQRVARFGPTSCPPVAYCTAGTSASGCQATLSSVGTPSATAPSGSWLQASTVEGQKDGLYFFGTSGRQANPWGNGTSYQCVGPPVKRAGLLAGSGANGACDGSFQQDLNALWCPTCPKPGHDPGAGATVQAQLWYRDPANTSNQTTSLSDAIEFVVGP